MPYNYYMKNWQRTSYLYIVLTAIIVTTLVLWMFSKHDLFLFISNNSLKAMTQFCALLGAIGYFSSYILSSRSPLLEKVFALDQAYRIHRIVGTLAGTGILLHVTTLLAQTISSPISALLYLVPGKVIPYNAGIFAFYFLLVLLATTLYVKLPYDIWKLLHKVTSFGIIFAIIHLLLIPSDISTYLPLRLWMMFWATLGVIAWIYREFLHTIVTKKYTYRVTQVKNHHNILLLTLTPLTVRMKAPPGSFAFFTFNSKNTFISSESHPFTILETEGDNMKIAIKALGDFTQTLQTLNVGATVTVTGPHGQFGHTILSTKGNQVWIAGGIGITPFFNVLKHLQSKKISRKNITFTYFTSELDTYFNPHVNKMCAEAGIDYSYVCTSKQGRQSPKEILGSKELRDTTYFLCGPSGMVKSYKEFLIMSGVARTRIVTEEFNFKSLEI